MAQLQEQAEYKPWALMILTVFLPCLAPKNTRPWSIGWCDPGDWQLWDWLIYLATGP